MKRKLLQSEEITTDFDNFNSFSNQYGLKTIDKCVVPPKGLVDELGKEFTRRCKEYHIDASAYPFFELTKFDTRWQIDFHDQKDMKGAKITFSSIIYSETKGILQAIFSI